MSRTTIPAAGGALPAATFDRRHFVATSMAATIALPLADFHEAQDAELFAVEQALGKAYRAYRACCKRDEEIAKAAKASFPPRPSRQAYLFSDRDLELEWEEDLARWRKESGRAASGEAVSKSIDAFFTAMETFLATPARTVEGLRLKATLPERYGLAAEDEEEKILAAVAADLKALDGGRLA